MIELYTKVGSQIFKRPDPFFQFPGGEWHVKHDGHTFVGNEAAVVTGTDPNDYVKLALWAACCSVTPRIVVPYLPAARADKGRPRGAAIYADLIPTYRKLVVLDAHSDYMVDYLMKNKNPNVVNYTAAQVLEDHKSYFSGVIAPDEGARDRAKAVADAWGIPLYQFKKERDFESGKILGITPPDNIPLSYDNRFLVVDDICDGGGTFNLLAQSLRDRDSEAGLSLYVSHGIFSNGIGDLLKNYSEIITTDSLSYIHPNDISLIKIKNKLLFEVYKDEV